MIPHQPPFSDFWIYTAHFLLVISILYVFVIVCLWLKEESYWDSFMKFIDENIVELKVIQDNLNKSSQPELIQFSGPYPLKEWFSNFYEKLKSIVGTGEVQNLPPPSKFLIGPTTPIQQYELIEQLLVYIDILKERKTDLAPKLKKSV